ncbi:MAG: hypothetical protein JJ959_10325 [Nisaea sp.]|uniref:hypothetical protein n=1 Tax=Nisaea sp. TaxID=2024842 RepID=UPI001B05B18B|nr:hypothetical protein [Nisaea sp.]MBO6560926.1 hypothetical protein [Nisaea sp.]
MTKFNEDEAVLRLAGFRDRETDTHRRLEVTIENEGFLARKVIAREATATRRTITFATLFLALSIWMIAERFFGWGAAQ